MNGNRKYVIAFLAIAILVPVFYAVRFSIPPEGKAFVAGNLDEVIYLDAARSVLWNYSNPLMPAPGTIFNDVVLGSPFVLAFLGIVSVLLSADALAVFVLVKFISVFFILLGSWRIIRFFMPDGTRKITLMLFLSGGGIGGIVYLYLLASGMPIQPDHFIFIAFMNPVTPVYYLISLACGYMGFAFLLEKKHPFMASALLGISLLSYPNFGAFFLFISAIYLVMQRNYRGLCIPAASTIFLIPWIFSYLESSRFFSQYYTIVRNYVHPGVFVTLTLFSLAFAVLYAVRNKSWNMKMLFVFVWASSAVVLTLLPPNLSLLQPQRFLWLSYLPLAIAGAAGIHRFIHDRKIIAVIVGLSMITLAVGYAAIYQNSTDGKFSGPYITENEKESLLFLSKQPQGSVISRDKFGEYIPYIAGKRAVLSNRGAFFYMDEALYADAAKIFSGAGNCSLTKKYNITYILVHNEDNATPSGKMIFENDEVKIFKAGCA